jgi:hypothetical protein
MIIAAIGTPKAIVTAVVFEHKHPLDSQPFHSHLFHSRPPNSLTILGSWHEHAMCKRLIGPRRMEIESRYLGLKKRERSYRRENSQRTEEDNVEMCGSTCSSSDKTVDTQ